MDSVHDYIRRHILEGLGITNLPYKHLIGVTADDLARTEWSPGFEQLMRMGLLQGAFRYGRLNAPGKPQWDRVADAKHRLDMYAKDGNVSLQFAPIRGVGRFAECGYSGEWQVDFFHDELSFWEC